MRVAIIGQAAFGAAVYERLRHDGHEIVGVFTPPDKGDKKDPLAAAATRDGVYLRQFPSWKKNKVLNPEVFEEYKACNPELNVMAFVSQFIPDEVLEYPPLQTIQYHPSVLPLHRGGSAINHTIINGDAEAGFTIFWVDRGVDAGPILLQRSYPIEENDTVTSIYTRELFPGGVDGMAEAVQLVKEGRAPRIVQDESKATHEPLHKKAVAKIDFTQPAQKVHNFIRGSDSEPGAWAIINGKQTTVFGSRLVSDLADLKNEACHTEQPIVVGDGESKLEAFVTENVLVFPCGDGQGVSVQYIQLEGGHMTLAANHFRGIGNQVVEERKLNAEEADIEARVYRVWATSLKLSAENMAPTTNFFDLGAGSLEATQLVANLSEEFDQDFPSSMLYSSPSVRGFAYAVIDFLANGGHEPVKIHKPTKVFKHKIKNTTIELPLQVLINGNWVDARSGNVYDTINPATEQPICAVPSCDVADVEDAVRAARHAFESGVWSGMNGRDRAIILNRLADLMERHKDELALIECLDSGIPITLAKKTHIGMAIDSIRYFAGWAGKIQGRVIPVNSNEPGKHHLTYTRHEPVGVCALILPWNFPCMLLGWKLGPALAAGNTVIVKPSPFTPLTALKVCQLAQEAGVPAGVLNVITGPGAAIGQALSSHMNIDKVAFTGSTMVGKLVMEAAARSNLKRVSLELGGKSPLIIFADADLKAAASAAASASWFNVGQNCIAGSRIYVEEAVYEKFKQMMVAKAKERVVGDPLDRRSEHGPMNNKPHFERVLGYIQQAVAEGANLLYGGVRHGDTGYYIAPAVLADLTDNMTITREETFGPICQLYKFKNGDIEGVLKRANNSEYGLCGGVFTSNMSVAFNVADRIKAGTVFINEYNKTDVAAPFGGFKQSGFGRDLSEYAIQWYTETKAVTIKY
eukprot:TRINITY_DN2229_c0_g1_i3.p1 TRINITY_DN2229_c0_g1~~TRINITY_DN2229_c0_g1_i3.p1  ORF type:complete len:918 (+),score=462.33 TRINITY_DN2229_c0_g1_i3:74-2827(+)